MLFRGTMRENIAYGRHHATEAQIIAAAKLANADEFIARMPRGYDTPIGERGVTLSGGQRQRIGIARAFIRNAPILILDEPTASLDTESEQLVMEGLERLMKGRTVIMITHRLNTIRGADTIIVLTTGSWRNKAHTTICWRQRTPAPCPTNPGSPGASAASIQPPDGARMARSLIVLPDDSAKPILAAIDGAAKTLRVKMFVFSDPVLLEAVIAAKHRGVQVRVMLNPARRSGEPDNEAAAATGRCRRVRARQQPGLRPHAREVDGGGRRDGVRQVAQLGHEEPDRDA